MNRRDFVKFLGAAGLAATYPAIAGVLPQDEEEESVVSFYPWAQIEESVVIEYREGFRPREEILAIFEKRIAEMERDMAKQLTRILFS